MTRSLPLPVLAGFLLAVLTAAGTSAAAPKVRMWQTKNAAVTEGYVDVAATPEELYRTLTDYARWPQVYTDIEWVKHKKGGREDALLECKSRTYGKTSQHFQFSNKRGRLIRYRMTDGPPGVVLWQETTFEPLEDTGLTRIRIKMHISVGGVLGWLTSDAKVRKYRERKVLRDLTDLGARWEPRPENGDGGN